MVEFSDGQNASRARSSCERLPAGHECRFRVAETGTVRTESQRVGAKYRTKPEFPERVGDWRVEAKRDSKTTHRSRRSRCAGTMDRASNSFVWRSHLANHARNRAGVGPTQRAQTITAG